MFMKIDKGATFIQLSLIIKIFGDLIDIHFHVQYYGYMVSYLTN